MAVRGLVTTHSAPRAPSVAAITLMRTIVDITAYWLTNLPGANMKVIGIIDPMLFQPVQRHPNKQSVASYCSVEKVLRS
jgi:hypothetical protein